MVLTFNRCGAYAANQDANSTAVGWAASYASADDARQAALTECRSRGGSGCIVRVWGCNGPVVEEGLHLDGAARRQVQEGGADGVFGPRPRAAIRAWQSSRGARATGYLDSAAAVDRRIRNSDGRGRLGSCGSVGERSWRRHAGAGAASAACQRSFKIPPPAVTENSPTPGL